MEGQGCDGTGPGYRAYDQAALGRLGFVRAADLGARIAQLERLRGELDRLAERASRRDSEQCPPERVCHIIG
jgi:hypothetical protein